MKRSVLKKVLIGLVVVALMLAYSSESGAAELTLDLIRTTGLTNVDDAAGRYQYDGGEVRFETQLIGYYARTKRVIFGATSPQNTATLSITIFLLGGDPPSNFTVHGSHSFNNGQEIGSISAASEGLVDVVGLAVKANSNSLTLIIP